MADTSSHRTGRSTPDEFLLLVAEGLELDIKEAAVYLAALRSGAQSVQAIAAAANTERTGTYDVLERLARRKYVRIDRIGKKGRVVLESPTAVRTLLSEKLVAVEAILPQLMALYEQHTDHVAVDRRVEGDAIALLLEQLRTGRLPIRLMVGSVSPLDSPAMLAPAIEAFTQGLIGSRAIVLVGAALSPATRRWLPQLQGSVACRQLPASASVTSTQLITGTNVVTLSAEPDGLVAIAVSSIALATHERSVFDVLWRTAKSAA